MAGGGVTGVSSPPPPADDRTAKNRLYTSISRATRELDVFALGELTPLLQ